MTIEGVADVVVGANGAGKHNHAKVSNINYIAFEKSPKNNILILLLKLNRK